MDNQQLHSLIEEAQNHNVESEVKVNLFPSYHLIKNKMDIKPPSMLMGFFSRSKKLLV